MLNKKSNETLVDQNEKPVSPLNTDIQIVLHTRIVQSLFNGSWRHGKLGLIQFAKIVSSIWTAAKQDDPYAEWYLMKTYQALFSAREQVKKIEATLTEHFSTLRGIEVNAYMNTKPITHPLTFSTPFGFMGAYLIADVDFILRQYLTLERMGISLHNENISIKQIVQLVQDAFSVPRHWRRTGVTRQDISENNQKASRANEKLGDIPESILHKQITFAFLPKKKELPNE